jgi:hypothetical protein
LEFCALATEAVTNTHIKAMNILIFFIIVNFYCKLGTTNLRLVTNKDTDRKPEKIKYGNCNSAQREGYHPQRGMYNKRNDIKL